jgi:4-carboxymuconolactone decarboxylase
MARRVQVITREQVGVEHTAAYDEITSIRCRPPVVGPTSVMIYSPEMALRANRLAEYLAEQSSLPEKFKRLAALIAARSMDCQYIWNAQAPAGRRAGLSDALVDALRDKKPLPAMPTDEAAVVHYGLELTGANKVGQETFQAALDQLGAQGLTEFTTSMGYFRMLALNANAFTIDLPEQRTESLLPI